MKCSNCGIEIGGKRYCPNCNIESKYEGASPVAFPKNSLIRDILRFAFAPRTLFILLCIIIVIAAQ